MGCQPWNTHRVISISTKEAKLEAGGFWWKATKVDGRRTEQAKANLDPRVCPRVAPRVGPRVAPRVRPREHPRGMMSLFSALQGLPTKPPTKVSTEGPTSGRSGFTCPDFTCSVLLPVDIFAIFAGGFLH